MRRTKKPLLPPAPGDLAYVVDFVNTKDHAFSTETWTRPAELRDWLVRQRLVAAPGELVPDDLEHARTVRRGLWALIAANSGARLDAEAVAALDRRAAEASCRARFAANGEVRLEPGSNDLAGALGRLCGIVAVARAEGAWTRVKICANPGCRRAYYDASRGRPSPYCTQKCRARVNSLTYRRRNRE